MTGWIWWLGWVKQYNCLISLNWPNQLQVLKWCKISKKNKSTKATGVLYPNLQGALLVGYPKGDTHWEYLTKSHYSMFSFDGVVLRTVCLSIKLLCICFSAPCRIGEQFYAAFTPESSFLPLLDLPLPICTILLLSVDLAVAMCYAALVSHGKCVTFETIITTAGLGWH